MYNEPTAMVVDGDEAARDGIGSCLRHAGMRVELFDGPEALLENYDTGRPGCLILEVQYGEMAWFELRQLLAARGCRRPFIIVTQGGTVAEAVQAMRDGAVDFIEKPYLRPILLERVHQAFDLDAAFRRRQHEQLQMRTDLASLTGRECEILRLLASGASTREIAARFGLSPKTIEAHRSNIVGKMRVGSIAGLIINLIRLQIELPTPTLVRRRA